MLSALTHQELELERVWSIMHVLTSDHAWRGGLGKLVDSYLNTTASMISRVLLRHNACTCEFHSTIASFMINNFAHVDDPEFTRSMRLYLYAYPVIYETYAHSDTKYCLDPHIGQFNTLWLAMMNYRAPIHVMATLLEVGVNVDSRNTWGQTPLMYAAEFSTSNWNKKMDLLIKYGAAIDAFDDCFMNAFHGAARGCNVGCLKTLLSARSNRAMHFCWATHSAAERLRQHERPDDHCDSDTNSVTKSDANEDATQDAKAETTPDAKADATPDAKAYATSDAMSDC